MGQINEILSILVGILGSATTLLMVFFSEEDTKNVIKKLCQALLLSAAIVSLSSIILLSTTSQLSFLEITRKFINNNVFSLVINFILVTGLMFCRLTNKGSEDKVANIKFKTAIVAIMGLSYCGMLYFSSHADPVLNRANEVIYLKVEGDRDSALYSLPKGRLFELYEKDKKDKKRFFSNDLRYLQEGAIIKLNAGKRVVQEDETVHDDYLTPQPGKSQMQLDKDTNFIVQSKPDDTSSTKYYYSITTKITNDWLPVVVLTFITIPLVGSVVIYDWFSEDTHKLIIKVISGMALITTIVSPGSVKIPSIFLLFLIVEFAVLVDLSYTVTSLYYLHKNTRDMGHFG